MTPSRTTSAWTLTALLALLMALTACNSGPIIRTMPNRMDGLFLDITVKKAKDSTAVYSVSQDGVFSFAGGNEAKRGEAEWTTPLDEEQRQRVLAMVQEFGWLEREPAPGAENPEHEYTVAIRRNSMRRTTVVHGDNPDVVKMVEFLDEIARHRFDDFIERLPQPGQQTR